MLLTQMRHSPGDLDLLVSMDVVNAGKETPAPRSA